MERHLEIEAKFDVGDGFQLPDLRGLPGVADVESRLQRLVATYYDTDDLRLLRAGATLRRRTGGGDAGWHLKLPLGAQRRLELRRPPGRPAAGVPEELTALARARSRAGELAPVARLTTRRRVHRLLDAEGTVLAEIADDAVTAETMGDRVTTSTWREVEVELVDGTPELLAAATKVLRRAGAGAAAKESKLARALSDRLEATGPASHAGEPGGKRPAAGDVALAHVREQVEELQSRDPDVRMEEHDAVHKMRVATRRLRSALATFRPLFDREVTDPLRDELKWLGGVLGGARDAEVMHERLTGELETLPTELVLGPVAKRIEDELRTTYGEAYGDLLVELDGERYLSLLDRLAALLADPPVTEVAGKRADKVLERRVQHTLRRVQRAVADVDEAPDAEQRDLRMHEVRKAAKRARYAGESVNSVFGKRAKKFAAGMESVQEILGAHQDSIVAQRVLVDLGSRAHLDGDNAFTYGVLVGLERCTAEATAADYAEVWATVEAAGKRWPG